MQKKRLRTTNAKNMLSGALSYPNSNGGATRIPDRIFSECPTSDLQGLDQVTVRQHYGRGSVLFVEGQQPLGVYLLREGRAKVSIASADGKTLVLRIAEPGDLLGVNATLSGRAYNATAETLDRCKVDFVSREQLLNLLDNDKRVYAGVIQALSRKLSSVIEHSRLLFLSQSASEKLARLLVKWCDEHGRRTSDGIRINSSLTHEELGQMICASRETVTRLLNELKRKEILSLGDNAIFVRNRSALAMLARY